MQAGNYHTVSPREIFSVVGKLWPIQGDIEISISTMRQGEHLRLINAIVYPELANMQAQQLLAWEHWLTAVEGHSGFLSQLSDRINQNKLPAVVSANLVHLVVAELSAAIRCGSFSKAVANWALIAKGRSATELDDYLQRENVEVFAHQQDCAYRLGVVVGKAAVKKTTSGVKIVMPVSIPVDISRRMGSFLVRGRSITNIGAVNIPGVETDAYGAFANLAEGFFEDVSFRFCFAGEKQNEKDDNNAA